MSKKKTQAFSLDQEIDDFIDKKRWDFKMNRSQIVNSVFKHFKNNESQLEEILNEVQE